MASYFGNKIEMPKTIPQAIPKIILKITLIFYQGFVTKKVD
jgi:hypothetical protein